MMATAELCRDVAAEAVRRGALGNVHELWAALEFLSGTVEADLVVDVGSPPATWWAWWSVCPNLIGAGRGGVTSPGFSGDRLPSTVVAIDGDPTDRALALRVTDQAARRPIDAVVLGVLTDEEHARTMWRLYSPLVKPGGVVLMRSIANPATPGVGRFWRGLEGERKDELIGAVDPDGYGG